MWKSESKDLNPYLQAHVHNRVIHNRQNVKTTQMSINRLNKILYMLLN